MYCSKCGKEVNDNMIFCPFCGEKLIENVIDIVEEETVEEQEKGPWKNFAKVGSILGKVSLCIFWLLGIGLQVGVFGIVFSCLGRKSKKNRVLADTGFNRSLLATILALGFITTISIIKRLIEYFN